MYFSTTPMTVEEKISQLFQLDDVNWLKHANPWSVWTRYSVLPVIILAFWSRVWIGWWCLLPAGVALLWMFINPLVFPKALSTKNWASKSVLGERVFMNRNKVPIPQKHAKFPHLLNIISAGGMIYAIYGIVILSPSAAIVGTLFTYLAKTWYLDRMVWLYEDMKHLEEYKKWNY